MTPFYFGSASHRLFGVYAPARAASISANAVLLCYPWGQEYIRAHRSMKVLANMLCGAGCHVLRFDYFGTGDSAGESSEVSLRGWEQDIETAMEELRDTSGAARVVLIGLRLGATLAAHVATRKRKEVDALVLWDPVIKGPEYLSELFSVNPAAQQQGERDREILSFPLTSAFEEEIRAIDLLQWTPQLPPRTRLVASLPLESHGELDAHLRQHARADIAPEIIEALYAWRQHQGLGAGAIPTKVLDTIVRWVR
jgi:uncharacterized protein